ncbi:MAG: hypothetical protein ACRDI2_25540 [Chloroflexota bacterium]
MTSSLVARTAPEALRQYEEPIQQALAGFARNTHLIHAGSGVAPDTRLLTPADEVIELRDAHSTPRLALAVELHYRAAPLPAPQGGSQRFTVQTVQYIYRLDDAAVPHQPIVGYHWHPHVEGVPFPHVHPYLAGSGGGRLHIVVAHATLYEVFATAVREFYVQPIKTDWTRCLREADTVLRASLEWAAAR